MSEIHDSSSSTGKPDGQDFVRSAFFERGHIFMPGNNVLIVTRINGHFDEDTLRSAIVKIRKRHPLLGVHLEFDEYHQAWFTSSNTLDIPLKTYTRTSEESWLEACRKENSIPFQLDKEPLLRVLWVKTSSPVSEVVLVGQHSICDGISLVYLMRDLLTYLADPDMEVEVLNTPPTLDQAANLNEIKVNWLIKLLLTRFASKWKEKEVIFTTEDFRPFQDVYNAAGYQVITHEMNQQETEKLIRVSREHGVTVNSLLYSALISAQLEIEGTEKKYLERMMMPISLREHLDPPIGDVVGMYAGGETFSHKMKLKKEFWKRTRDLHRYLLKKITPNGMLSTAKQEYMIPLTLTDARIMLILGSKLPESSPKYEQVLEVVQKDASLRWWKNQYLSEDLVIGMIPTNLGNLDIPTHYGEIELESICFIPPASLMAEKVIGILTVGGKLRFAVSYFEEYFKPELAQRWFKRALEILEENSN